MTKPTVPPNALQTVRHLPRDLAPAGRPVKGGTPTYSNSFTCVPDSVAAPPDLRQGDWILDSSR